jgi:hypothetical protein
MRRISSVVVVLVGAALPSSGRAVSYDQMVDACAAGDMDIDCDGNGGAEPGWLEWQRTRPHNWAHVTQTPEQKARQDQYRVMLLGR